jgi:tetratricopeptide (TPR) repeat protein
MTFIPVSGRLLAFGLSFVLLCSCGPTVVDDEKPTKAANVRSLALINLPVLDVEPIVQQDVLTTLAERIHKRYKIRVNADRSVGKAVWGKLDTTGKRACDQFRAKASAVATALSQLRIGKALELSSRARGLLNYCGPELRDVDPARTLYLNHGRALFARDRRDEALEAFRLAVSLQPAGDLPSASWQAEPRQALERARRQLLSGNPTRMQVLSEPEGADVFIDGKSVGTTPLDEAQLFPGQHFIRIEKQGFASWSTELRQGVPPLKIKAWLVPIFDGPSPENALDAARDAEQPKQDASEQLKAIAAHLQVDGLLLVRLFREEGRITLATQLYIPATDLSDKWRTFDLGPRPANLKTKLEQVARIYPELAKKPAKKKKKKQAKKTKKTKKTKKGKGSKKGK